MIHSWQHRLYEEHGTHFIHAGDEWYLLAEREMPDEDSYDGYLQLENGVGMVRLLTNEVAETMDALQGDGRNCELSIATGVLAAPIMENLVNQIQQKYPNIKVHIYTIKNDFFGERITVAGLLTGQDILKQLKDKNLGDKLILSANVLRMGEDVFLDDMTLEELAEKLQIKIEIAGSSGCELVDAVIGGE